MALKEITEQVEGKTYKTILFPSKEGLHLSTRVVKFIGPLINGTGGDIDLTSFVEHLSEPAVCKLAIDLLRQTYYIEATSGHVIDEAFFDEHFAGEYLHLYKVLWFIIKANGFFGKGNIGSMLQSLGMKTPTVLPKS